MTPTRSETRIPWWREPTRDQWLAWTAGWLGWTLDAFDFTIFLLLLVPITQEFRVPLTAAKDLHFTPAQVAFPVAMTSLLRRRGPACSPATTTPAWPWRC